jgi:hypothetical protein
MTEVAIEPGLCQCPGLNSILQASSLNTPVDLSQRGKQRGDKDKKEENPT